jgi:hypothetical protein
MDESQSKPSRQSQKVDSEMLWNDWVTNLNKTELKSTELNKVNLNLDIIENQRWISTYLNTDKVEHPQSWIFTKVDTKLEASFQILRAICMQRNGYENK